MQYLVESGLDVVQRVVQMVFEAKRSLKNFGFDDIH